MADLKRMHDLSPFTDREGRYGLNHLKYDAEAKKLIATNGRIAVLAPVEGNSCPTALIPAKTIRDAIKSASSETVELVGKKKELLLGGKSIGPSAETRFPDIYKVYEGLPEVDRVLCFTPEALKALVDYASKHGKAGHGIYFAVPKPAKRGEIVTEKLQFVLETNDGLVSGLIMPCAGESMSDATIRERFAMAREPQKPFPKPPADRQPTAEAKATPAKSKQESQPVASKAAPKPVNRIARTAPGPVAPTNLLQRARDAIANCIESNSPGFRASARRLLNAAEASGDKKAKAEVESLRQKLDGIPTTSFKR